MDALTAAVIGFMLGVFTTLAAERARRVTRSWHRTIYCRTCGHVYLGLGHNVVIRHGQAYCPQCGGAVL